MKALPEILVPDPRNRDGVLIDKTTGQVRQMEIADFYELIDQVRVSEAAPRAARQLFELARNAFLYSWFVYEFASIAEMQAYAAVEMALRQKYEAMTGETAGRRTLKSLIEQAERRGWLRRADFGDVAGPFHPFDAIVLLRNDSMHGTERLMPMGSLEMISLCREIIDGLFATERGLHGRRVC